VGLFDTTSEEPHSKRLRYIVTGVAGIILISFFIWYFFLRYIVEKRVVLHFMDAVVAGNYQQAYQIWKPHGTYSYQDFIADWGKEGYYAPVGSFRFESAEAPRDATGIVIVVEISPFQPFPSNQDPKSARNREVRLWVDRSDESMSFPP